MGNRTIRRFITALAAVGLGVPGAAAFGYARGWSDEITACVESDGGGLYLAEKCQVYVTTRGERRVGRPVGSAAATPSTR